MKSVLTFCQRCCVVAIFALVPSIIFGAAPVIHDFSPKSGSNGTTVTITGNDFGLYPSNNVVYFGAVRATVTSAGLILEAGIPKNTLTVQVPPGATYAPITVLVNGLVSNSSKPFEPTFPGPGGSFDSTSFAAPLTFAMPQGPQQVVIADLDGDGKPDLVVDNVYSHNISIFRNISSGGVLSSNSFAPRFDLPTLFPANQIDNPYDVTVADVDGDGKLDIVTFDRYQNKIIVYQNISVPGALDTNSFAAPVFFDAAADPRGVLVADIDGDGRPDIIYSAAGANAVSILRNVGTPGVINSNSFAPHVEFPVGAMPLQTAVGDLDGDGKLDIVTANFNDNSVSVLQNFSSPGVINSNSFAAAVNLPTPSGTLAVALGDIDGDGKSDLVIGCFGGTLSLYRNAFTIGSISSNSFDTRVDFPTAGRAHNIALADLNGDGKLDIALVTELNSALSIFQNVSSPGSLTTDSLAPRVDYATGYNAWGVAVGDLDGDGRPDIVFANAYDATMWIYQNTVGSGGSVSNAPVITSQPADQTASAGDTVQFSVSATGSAPLYYQWYRNHGDVITGAISSTLTLSNVQPSDAGSYFVFVTNSFGFATSSNAVLTVTNSGVGLPPVITQQPSNQTASAGDTVQFSVSATGSAPLYYQWYRNAGDLIHGAITPTLTISNVQPSDAGSYFVFVTNSFGFATSSNATLTVTGGTNGGGGSCTPPPSSIVGWWRGENNALDSAGTNNGFLLGGVGFANGEVGQGFLFTHTNDDVRIPANSDLDVGLGDGLTLEAWINPQDVTKFNPIFEWNAADGVTYWGVHLYVLSSGPGSVYQPGTLYADVQGSDDSWHQLWSPANTVTNNSFQHVALTYDKASGVARLYYNGQVVAEQNFGSFTPKTSTDLHLGSRPIDPAGSQFTFTGVIDEAAVYNRALASNEIAAIYDAGSNGKCTGSTSSNLPPVITQQPSNQTASVGSAAQFSVTATGSAPLYYQWYRNAGDLIHGAITPTLTISNVQPSDAGSYYVTVTNSFGFATSSNATLTVSGSSLPTALVQVVDTSTHGGASFTVPIILVAKGNENALSFSLHFDASTLTFSNVVLGVNATNGFILANANQATNGNIGVELALPSGQTFNPGTQQLARVTFVAPTVAGIEPLITPVGFTSHPIAELLSDAQGNSLNVAFTNGIVAISPNGLEGDVMPRPGGDGKLDVFDWVQVGRFVAGLDTISNSSEFQRVDCAPRTTLGDGQIRVTDWVQAGRYAAGLDPATAAGGPTGPSSSNAPIVTPHAPVLRQLTVSSGSTVKGLPITMPINLQAQGDESALAFSLSFDPAVLSYVSTANGSAATSATLVVNTNQAASGKIAIVMCLPGGGYFPAGLDEVAKVNFVAVGSATSNSVSFADLPVARSISDTNATELPANYIANSIVVNPQPAVNLSSSGGTSVFSWPVWAGDFQLQSADSLTPPITWTDVPVTLQTNGNNIQVTLPATDGQKFYRLYHP